ncbi:PREDICTED: transmembrane protein 89 [Condylura cristata]|uniref:transmembrane protein 89 n=1 Tax=Condylura cristata TaxID=143302 RepID=UPI0003347041|nr:PREDICTED: transmembrane protein 89 [Condylura cristata]
MSQTPSFLPLLLLLVTAAPTHGWSRPVWYQVGLDLQPWGCQPNNLDGCRVSLGCPRHWMGLGGKHIYPVAGVTLTTTMMLLISRAVLQRRRGHMQATQGEQAQVTTDHSASWKRRVPISDRALIMGALHMLDSLLVHIESHLQRLATQKQTPIKGTTPAQSG